MSEDRPASGIVDFTDLQRISQLKQKGAVLRYLKKLRVRFEVGADGAPWTTIQAINNVLLSKDGSVKRYVRSADGLSMVGAAEPNLAAIHRPRLGGRRKKTPVT